ncbi:hypothetical protein ANCDUO_12363 [Ancylostoma duodenale]|uniref:Uncharacterized protein n=1 Tax=Ancylostoma duodenale TaxID=51022 RepID=A0A0C2D5R9_9BILA|nr:hypothetical protein ANCDUO_12363 [Ancylostoma duodenale]
MGVHGVTLYLPGSTKFKVPTHEGIVRHYRDIDIDHWSEWSLPMLRAIGDFENTTYPEFLGTRLFESVRKRLDYVYLK